MQLAEAATAQQRAGSLVTPFFFGRKARRLYGVYHPATRRVGPVRAVVLCHPWGPEYAQAHRTVRLLADMLAASGLHALRFDYFGTGDSGGDLLDGDVVGWRDDVLTAAEELREISGAAAVSLVGLRFGATVAALVAQHSPADVSNVLLWDPVARLEQHLNEFGRNAIQHAHRRLRPVPLVGSVEGQEVLGFPISTAFRQQAGALDLGKIAATLTVPVDLVMSGDLAPFDAMKDLLSPSRLRLVSRVPAQPCWLQGINFVPRAVLQAIVQAFGSAA